MPTRSLSPDETDVLLRLAQPIAFGQREKFLQAVTNALASCPEPGPGVIHRAAREIQRGFTLQAQRETVHRDEPRHLAAMRAAIRA